MLHFALGMHPTFSSKYRVGKDLNFEWSTRATCRALSHPFVNRTEALEIVKINIILAIFVKKTTPNILVLKPKFLIL